MSDQLELDFDAPVPDRRAARKRPPDPKTAQRIRTLRERYGTKRAVPVAGVINLAEVRRSRGLAPRAANDVCFASADVSQLGGQP